MPTSLNGARAPSASLVKKWKERDSMKGRTPRLPTSGTKGTIHVTERGGGIWHWVPTREEMHTRVEGLCVGKHCPGFQDPMKDGLDTHK